MKIAAIDLPSHDVAYFRKVLNGLEVKLSDAKARRFRVAIDVRKVSGASDMGDQRARFALGGLNTNSAAAGRDVLSFEVQVAEARKRLAMAETQASVVEAKRASADAGTVPRDRLFEVTTPDGRIVRHRHASAGALRAALLPGYVVRGEVFGADVDGNGGLVDASGSGTPSLMAQLLAAHGGELEAWLAGPRRER